MRTLLSIVAAAFMVGISMGAQASSTDWVQHDDMLRTRIVVGSVDAESDKLLLAWEADLQPGWKTYWRSPGEAGLPVRVQVAGDEKELLYPVPERFEIFGLTTYGYKDRVVLPFYTEAQRDKPITVSASFMVCKEICVPFDTIYELPNELSDSSIHDTRIDSWMKRVPSKGENAGLEISRVRVTGKPGRQRLVVDVAADHSLSDADLLAETTDGFEFGAPTVRLQDDGTSARFVLPVMTMSREIDLREHEVRFTLIDSAGNAIDRTISAGS